MTRVDVPGVGTIDIEWHYDAFWLWIGGSVVVGGVAELLTNPSGGEQAAVIAWIAAGALVVDYTVSNARDRAETLSEPPHQGENG
jgi:hypothetical protein